MKIDYPEGATPLDPNELDGLIPTSISTRNELDRWEQENILEALNWLAQRKPKQILSEKFVRELHRRMFYRVWKWAGEYRKRDKNLGVPHWKIPEEVKKLCDDALYWIQENTFKPDELAARFHHRLVSVHPFANGNGRHARLMADLIAEHLLNCPPPSWGKDNLAKPGEVRAHYIEALKLADKHQFEALIAFLRS